MKICLDDERIPVQEGWEVVTNHDDFIMYIVLYADVITHLSLDHDLGDDSEDGGWCLRWMIEEMISDHPLRLPHLKEIIVHSANRVGSENMIAYARNAVTHIEHLKDVKITWLDSSTTQGHVMMPATFNYDTRL